MDLENKNNVAYFAAGCFWGVEHYFSKFKGVKAAISGFMGGDIKNPTYEQICTKKTNHLEVVKVEFDENVTNFEELCKFFFEIHNPQQVDGQGPDIGPQYLSAIFVIDENQRNIAQKLIKKLEKDGLKIATKIIQAKERGAQKFWPAEDYHQQYYGKNGQNPYCHFHIKRF